MPTTLATDNFNRADGGLGANWTTITGKGSPQVNNNVAVTTAVGTDSMARYSAISWPDNQYAQVKVSAVSSSASGTGPIVRCATGAASFYLAYVTGLSGGLATIKLTKYTTGTGSDLVTATNQPFAVNDVLRLEVSGNPAVLKVYRNGIVISALNFTDSSSPFTSGQPGFLAYVDAGAVTDSSADDWEGGDLGTPPAATCVTSNMVVLATPSGQFLGIKP